MGFRRSLVRIQSPRHKRRRSSEMTKSPFPSGKLPEADTLRVATVCDLFLDHSQKHHVPDTFRWYKKYLQNFCDPYGTLLVQDLKALHVSRWLDAHSGW